MSFSTGQKNDPNISSKYEKTVYEHFEVKLGVTKSLKICFSTQATKKIHTKKEINF